MADIISEVISSFKEKYADEVTKLQPETSIIAEDAPFLNRKMIGKAYIMPVCLSSEQGFTYVKNGGGAATLAASYGANIQRATVTGQSVVLRTIIATEDLLAGDDDSKAVEDVMDLITTNAMSSVHNRLEIGRIYGGLSIGATTGKAITDPSSPLSASVTMGVTLTAASWSSGIWSASIGSLIKFISSDAPTGSVQGGGNFRVLSVDCSTRTLTIGGSNYTDSNATGNILTLETYLTTSANVGYIFFSEAVHATDQVEQLGYKKIITTSGSVFGISNITYGNWAGNVYDVGTSISGKLLTLKHILLGMSKAVGRGFMGPMNLYVAPATFATLANDQAALRKYDASYNSKEATNGSENIKFHAGNGLVTIKTHFFLKDGDAIAVPAKEAFRVGSSDVKFDEIAGNGQYMKALEDTLGYELRVITNQAIFIRKPNWAVYFRYIDNTSAT